MEFPLQIRTKGRNNRSLYPQILLGLPDKGKNPKSTDLYLLHFLRLKIFISKSCSASLVSVRSYIFFMSTYGASEEGDIPFHSK